MGDPIGTVGFIGLGQMGGGMVTRIVDAGFRTVLWARRPEVLAEFDAPNVCLASSPAELAGQVDLLGICVWSDDDVREVFAGVLEGCRPGTIIAIHSTILPATCRELAAAAAKREVVVLDAPVTGGRDVALSGSLGAAIGGDAEALDRCRPVFETFASSIIRLGDAGTAQFAKLINNTLLAANLVLADDALSLGELLGIDPAALVEFLRGGSGRSYGVDVALMTRTSEDIRRGALVPLEKDVHCLLIDAASGESAKARMLSEAAREAVQRLSHPHSPWT